MLRLSLITNPRLGSSSTSKIRFDITYLRLKMFLNKWKINTENAALAELTLDVHVSAVAFYNSLHIAQAKAETFHVMHISRWNPIKFLKNSFLILRGDSNPIVLHFYGNSAVGVLCFDPDLR